MSKEFTLDMDIEIHANICSFINTQNACSCK
jgi:hypothetical protein